MRAQDFIPESRDLETVVKSFVASPQGQKYRQHDCKTVTRAFVDWAEQNGIPTRVISLAPPSAEFIEKNPRFRGKSGEGDAHIMPVVSGDAIDFTVRQFGVNRSFERPLITPVVDLPSVYGRFGYFTDRPRWFLGGKSHWIGPLRSIPPEIFNQDFGDELLEQGLSEGTGSYPEVLYHGSTQEITGPLTPRQAHDIGGAAGSNKLAIYATDDPNFAIAYSLAERGSDTGTMGWRKDPRLIFFGGKIRHGENVYLHVLPTRDQQGRPLFTKGAADAEWYSLPGVKEITPTEVKSLPVDQYLHLLRKPTPREQKLFQANKAKAKQGVAEGRRR